MNKLPKIKNFKKCNETVIATRGKYLINPFGDGFTDDWTTFMSSALYANVLNNKVVAFVECTCDDKILSTFGTKKRIESIIKNFEIGEI